MTRSEARRHAGGTERDGVGRDDPDQDGPNPAEDPVLYLEDQVEDEEQAR